MGDALTDDDVREAVARALGKRRVPVDLRAPGAVELTRMTRLECRIHRSLESRSEKAVRKQGVVDLSARGLYDDLASHRVPPPKDPRRSGAVELVRRGSVRVEECARCSEGQVACPACGGGGEKACTADVACPSCHGIDPCAECHGTGSSPRRSAARRTAEAAAAAARRAEETAAERKERESRVHCGKCSGRNCACPGCRGRGRVVCPRCRGTERYPCPDCRGKGTRGCSACAGKGRFTAWTQGTVRWTADPGLLTRPHDRLPRAVRRATDAVAWHSEGGRTEGLEPAHRTAVEEFLAPAPGEVARRVQLRHLPVVRAVVLQDPHHVYYVFRGTGGPEAVVSRSRRRTAQTAAAAVFVLVLLGIVVALVR